jgi:hypothetical protein
MVLSFVPSIDIPKRFNLNAAIGERVAGPKRSRGKQTPRLHFLHFVIHGGFYLPPQHDHGD